MNPFPPSDSDLEVGEFAPKQPSNAFVTIFSLFVLIGIITFIAAFIVNAIGVVLLNTSS